MTQLNGLDVCRLCLTSAERLGELTHHLTYIISTCFSLEVCMYSELTNKICQVCVDQLENVYKYRKKIIRNNLILLKNIRENITYHPTMLYSEDSQKEVDINEVNDDIVRFNGDDESDTKLTVNEEIGTEIKKLKDASEQKETEHNIGLNNIKTNELHIRVNELNDLHRNQQDVKLNNSDVTKKEDINDLNENKNSLDKNKKPLPSIPPIIFQSINQYNSTLETDKENADINNLTTTDFTVNDNEFIFKNLDGNPGVILNQEHVNTLNIDKKNMCLMCLKIFESQKELSIHYKTVELSKAPKETSKKCMEVNMLKVLKNYDDKTVFQCSVCSKVFENKASVIKHTQVHKIERPFVCNLCGRTYKTVDDILRHGVVHSGNKFVCSYECGYATVHLGALRDHVKRHKKEFKYKCEKCSKCFQVKTWYDQHQNVHNKIRPFVCNICGQSFSMARYLTAHRANVHPQSSKVKRYKCVQCALPCDSRKSLVMHMKQKHGMKTDCLCDVCGQILPDQQKLSLHKNTHKTTRKYSCMFCKKTFNKKDHKTVHEKIHTGERLNCNSCPKSFTQRCSLRRHIKRYHPGDQLSVEQKI